MKIIELKDNVLTVDTMALLRLDIHEQYACRRAITNLMTSDFIKAAEITKNKSLVYTVDCGGVLSKHEYEDTHSFPHYLECDRPNAKHASRPKLNLDGFKK